MCVMINADLKAMDAPIDYRADQFLGGALLTIRQLESEHPESIHNIGLPTKPPIIRANLSGEKKRRAPKLPSKLCPSAGNEPPLYDITNILSCSLTGKRIMFLVALKEYEFKRWIDYDVLKKLEPKHIFVSWLLGLSIFHPSKMERLRRRAKKLGFDHELDAMAGVKNLTPNVKH
jgi:hypothetical protein